MSVNKFWFNIPTLGKKIEGLSTKLRILKCHSFPHFGNEFVYATTFWIEHPPVGYMHEMLGESDRNILGHNELDFFNWHVKKLWEK